MIHNNLWPTEEDEFEALSTLSNVSRYNTRYRIKNESVAAHSFYTIWFTSVICSYFGLNPELTQKAMECAMVHDIPEIYINDITYDCKQMIPDITKMIEPYERTIIDKLSDVAESILFDPKNLEEQLINLIVRFADVVSVKQYSMSEIKLGNASFASILEGANLRLDEISQELNKVYEEYTGGPHNAEEQ